MSRVVPSLSQRPTWLSESYPLSSSSNMHAGARAFCQQYRIYLLAPFSGLHSIPSHKASISRRSSILSIFTAQSNRNRSDRSKVKTMIRYYGAIQMGFDWLPVWLKLAAKLALLDVLHKLCAIKWILLCHLWRLRSHKTWINFFSGEKWTQNKF